MIATRGWICAAFLALCSAAAPQAAAVPYPTEPQFRSAIADAAVVARAENLRLEILDAHREGITRPLMSAGLSLGDGVCVVFYNTTPLAELQVFFESVHPADLPVWLDALAVHEVAHCIEQREAYVNKRFVKVLPPGMKLDDQTTQGYLSIVKSGAVGAWGEAFADIVAVLYLKQALPDHWRGYAAQLADMRAERGRTDPEHNTAPWLRAVIAAGAQPAPGQSLYEAAFEMRTRFRPDPAAPAE